MTLKDAQRIEISRRQVLRAALLSVPGLMAGCRLAQQPDRGELYSARAIVTGQSEANSAPLVVQCLTDTLVKVSGDPSLASDPGLAAWAGQARSLATGLSYHDRMEGLPIGDEQGTRDRPYDLTVNFAPERIDALLKALGRAAWTGPRPVITMIIGVRNPVRDYILASDGEWGVDQRAALSDAAWQMGLSAILPGSGAPSLAGLTFDKLAAANPSDFASAAATISPEVPLIGTMVWRDGVPGWRADWRLSWKDKTSAWQAVNVNFDEAFRVAMRGALKILSGHGAPI
jgi:uncharacterized protein